MPDEGPGFAGASKIIDSEELRKLLDADATQHIDARAFLAARLVDFVINDNDRHEGNWKWAHSSRTRAPTGNRSRADRDHAFVSYDGAYLSIARLAAPSLVSFGEVPSVKGLTTAAGFDARLLSGLEKPVWDSVARALQSADHGLGDQRRSACDACRIPRSHRRSSTPSGDSAAPRCPTAAAQFYRMLAARVEVHGTDAADRAVITGERPGRRGPSRIEGRTVLRGDSTRVRRLRFSSTCTMETIPRSSAGGAAQHPGPRHRRERHERAHRLVHRAGNRNPTRFYDAGTGPRCVVWARHVVRPAPLGDGERGTETAACRSRRRVHAPRGPQPERLHRGHADALAW